MAYSSICRIYLSSRYSIAQIAGWLFPFFLLSNQMDFVPLPRSLKRSGALLGSNSMRNRTAQIDRNEQESLLGFLLFHS